MSKRSPKLPKKESLSAPPPSVSSRLSSLPIRSTPTPPTVSAKPAPVLTTRPTPPVKISSREPQRITTRPSESDDEEDESDDSDWDLDEDGIDDAYAEHLYDFFRQQKKSDSSNKALYNYIVKVFDDKEDFDEKKLDALGIDRVIDTLSTRFAQYMKEEDVGGKSFKPLTKDVLVTYLDAGLDDNFEDDGWIVKDE